MIVASKRIACSALAALALPLVVGCEMPLSAEDARVAFASVETGVGASSPVGQALSVDSKFEVDCRYGGSLSFDGSLDTDAGETLDGNSLTTFEYDVLFDKCQNDDNVVDGDVQYGLALGTQVGDGTASMDLVYAYRGTIVVQGEANGACDFDVRGMVQSDSTFGDGSFSNDSEWVYEGDLCGHDAEDVLDDDYDSPRNRSGSFSIDIDT